MAHSMETFPTVLIITMNLEEPEAGSSKIRESPGNSKSLCALRRATLHETEGDMAVLLFLLSEEIYTLNTS